MEYVLHDIGYLYYTLVFVLYIADLRKVMIVNISWTYMQQMA